MKKDIIWRMHRCVLLLSLFNYQYGTSNGLNGEKCSKHYKMQDLDADYIIGGFVPAHIYDYSSGKRYKLNYLAIPWASAILHAVREINKDQNLLPGIHLGYAIRDSCSLTPLAVRYTLDYLLDVSFLKPVVNINKYINSSCIERENSQNVIFGIIGAEASPISSAVNNILSVDYIPQVSYGSTAASLSDPLYRSFLRTVPSDIHQADAIVALLIYFNWTYVSVFVEDDEYGRKGLDEIRKSIKKKEGENIKNRLCLAGEIVFNVIITKRDKIRTRNYLKRLNGKSHVVIIWSGIRNAIKIMVESQRSGIPNITWIGTEAWGTHPDLVSHKLKITQNIIGLEVEEQKTPKFEEAFLSKTSINLNCDNPWFQEYLSDFQNSIRSCNLTCSGPATPCQKMFYSILARILIRKKIDHVITAVYALAHGLRNALNCSNGSCIRNEPLNHASVYNHIIGSEVWVPDINRTVKFDHFGEISNATYIYKFYNPRTKKKKPKDFGHWSSDGTLSINSSAIEWGKQEKPIAHCSDDCVVGSYRLNGSSPCCWSCVPCIGDSYTTALNSFECSNCPLREIANNNHTQCIRLHNMMKVGDKSIIIHLALAVFGILCTSFVIGVFIRYWDTPIVKSASREMSFIQLVSILFLFSYAGLAFVPDSQSVCIIRIVAFSFLHCTILALILVKTYRLLMVFRQRFTAVSKFLHNKYQIAFSYIIVLILVVAVSLWFVYFPSKIIDEINRDKQTYNTSCGNDIVWFAVLFYLLVLELVISGMAFRARKLPENFNEVQFIVFTMFTDIIVWLFVLLALYVSLDRLGFSHAFLYVNFISNICRLFILFGYKIRIILFFPELNSPEHFRKTATGITITNFVKEVKKADGTYIKRVQSVVSFQEDVLVRDPLLSDQAISKAFSSLKKNFDGSTTSNDNAPPNDSNDLSQFNAMDDENGLDTSKFLSEFDDTEIQDWTSSDKDSSSSLRALTPDLHKGPLHDIKKWASTQLLCSNENCNTMSLELGLKARSSSVDCLHRYAKDALDRSELNALLTMPETTM